MTPYERCIADIGDYVTQIKTLRELLADACLRIDALEAELARFVPVFLDTYTGEDLDPLWTKRDPASGRFAATKRSPDSSFEGVLREQ